MGGGMLLIQGGYFYLIWLSLQACESVPSVNQGGVLILTQHRRTCGLSTVVRARARVYTRQKKASDASVVVN